MEERERKKGGTSDHVSIESKRSSGLRLPIQVAGRKKVKKKSAATIMVVRTGLALHKLST